TRSRTYAATEQWPYVAHCPADRSEVVAKQGPVSRDAGGTCRGYFPIKPLGYSFMGHSLPSLEVDPRSIDATTVHDSSRAAFPRGRSRDPSPRRVVRESRRRVRDRLQPPTSSGRCGRSRGPLVLFYGNEYPVLLPPALPACPDRGDPQVPRSCAE